MKAFAKTVAPVLVGLVIFSVLTIGVSATVKNVNPFKAQASPNGGGQAQDGQTEGQ